MLFSIFICFLETTVMCKADDRPWYTVGGKWLDYTICII